MADSVLDRLRDRLAVNAPYAGLVAQGYDAWIPVDDIGPDDAVYLSILDRIEGTALELGCGTGRPLLHWLALGHDVEGIDASADMLTILRGHAAERALQAVVHLGDIAPLTLGRRYDALFCPAGTFTLIDDPQRAREAVASWFEHLDPGGHLALTLGIPTEDFDEQMRWRVRRTGTTNDGTTIVVHEAVACDVEAQRQVIFNRIEAYDANGLLDQTWLRRIHLRWWTQAQLAELLASVGFVDIRSFGEPDGWVTVARRAS